MSKYEPFNDLEKDLLCETFNLGVGKAASFLSQMVKEEVNLSVPIVEFVSVDDISETLNLDTDVCSVGQFMEGKFSANSLLLFPEPASLEIVKRMLGGDLSDEMVAELQAEAFSEIGNILLNACIGAISTMLSLDFNVSLPRFQIAPAEKLLRDEMVDQDDLILLIRIDMTLCESQLSGYLVFLLESTSMHELHGSLNKMLNGIGLQA